MPPTSSPASRRPRSPSDALLPILREMIHAINSPIGVFLGSAQFALECLADKSVADLTEEDLAEIKESLRMMERQAKRCARLIKDLRVLAIAGQLEPERVELGARIRAALESIPWTERGIDVIAEIEEIEVMGDGEKLEDAIRALLTNAAEAMPEGGRLHISARTVMDMAQVVFDDTGTGILEKDLPKVFSPLFSTKPGDGRGKGLALVRLILAAHGGEIELESEPGRGTRITLTLPRERAEDASIPAGTLEDKHETSGRG